MGGRLKFKSAKEINLENQLQGDIWVKREIPLQFTGIEVVLVLDLLVVLILIQGDITKENKSTAEREDKDLGNLETDQDKKIEIEIEIEIEIDKEKEKETETETGIEIIIVESVAFLISVKEEEKNNEENTLDSTKTHQIQINSNFQIFYNPTYLTKSQPHQFSIQLNNPVFTLILNKI